jgi:hypothetical protein
MRYKMVSEDLLEGILKPVWNAVGAHSKTF